MEELKTYRLKDFMEFNPKVSTKKNTLAPKNHGSSNTTLT